MAPVEMRRVRRGPVLALGAAAVTLLTAACGPFGAATDAATASRPLSTAAAPAGTASVLGTGTPAPAPSTPFPPAATAPDPYWHLTAPPVATATPRAAGTPTGDDCSQNSYIGVTVAAAAVPGAPGTARVSWTSRASTSLQEWRVAVEPQAPVSGNQPPLRWQTVPVPAGCATASTTITGLTSGQYYSFWLHALVAAPEDPGASLVMVGRSPALLVP